MWWDLLIALAQVLSVVFVIAGFGLVTWHSWSGSSDERRDD